MGMRGFTLIELLVVIGIIVFAATIVIVSLNNASTKGRDARRLEDAKQIRNALTFHFDRYTQYPAALSDLVPEFLSALPTDPVGQVPYHYDLSPGGASYHLGMNLERADSLSLQTDADINSATIQGDDATSCSGSAATSRHCYDIVP